MAIVILSLWRESVIKYLVGLNFTNSSFPSEFSRGTKEQETAEMNI